MVNKKMFWFGILAMVLVFGMMVVGCDNGSTKGNGNMTVIISGLENYNGREICITARRNKNSWISVWGFNGKYFVSDGSVSVTEEIGNIVSTKTNYYIGIWIADIPAFLEDPLQKETFAKKTYKFLKDGIITLKYPDDFE